MTADEITLRSPAPDEMRAFFQPIADAFSEDMSEPEFDTERRLLEPERCVSAFDGDKRVGSSAAYSFRLTVPGGEVGAAGDHRGRRPARPPSPRDPPADDDVAARRRHPAGRGGRGPRRVRGGDLPALRVRTGHDDVHVQHRSGACPVPRSRAAGPVPSDPDGRRGRGRPALPGGLRRDPRRPPGGGRSLGAQVAALHDRRRRLDASTAADRSIGPCSRSMASRAASRSIA